METDPQNEYPDVMARILFEDRHTLDTLEAYITNPDRFIEPAFPDAVYDIVLTSRILDSPIGNLLYYDSEISRIGAGVAEDIETLKKSVEKLYGHSSSYAVPGELRMEYSDWFSDQISRIEKRQLRMLSETLGSGRLSYLEDTDLSSYIAGRLANSLVLGLPRLVDFKLGKDRTV